MSIFFSEDLILLDSNWRKWIWSKTEGILELHRHFFITQDIFPLEGSPWAEERAWHLEVHILVVSGNLRRVWPGRWPCPTKEKRAGPSRCTPRLSRGDGRLHGHEALLARRQTPQGPLASVYWSFSHATPGPHRSALSRFSSLRGGDRRGRAWASEGPGVHPFSRQNKPGVREASWSQHRNSFWRPSRAWCFY